jgi:NRAMP (natural resistance-associated macrophage protein)-like metal ion transporter
MTKILSFSKKLIAQLKKKIGPGFITGAADDDPSGIATYSIAGAKFNLSLLWTAIFTWPLMATVQMMCARIGMVTGCGLAAALRKKFSYKLVMISSFILFIANTFNISADLLAIADAMEILTKVGSHIWIIIFAIMICLAVVQFKYTKIANFLKWLACVLFAYVISAFCLNPDWSYILGNAFLPSLPSNSDGWSMLLAIFGTTISPYLFYWQVSEEVEEEISLGRVEILNRVGATKEELFNRKIDVAIGTFFSNIVMFFIILTTALTLHLHGITNIETSSQVAKALEPIAGSSTMILYTLGLIGTGVLAIVTLAGSSAYAFADTFSWPFGFDKKLKQAKSFYFIILLSTFIAVAFDFSNINAIKILYWSAILNGILAPFLLVGILIIASDSKIMENQPSSKISKIIVGATIILMFLSLTGMLVF